LLREALEKWEKIAPGDRLPADDPKDRTSALRRAERFYPEGGLVLHVYSRDLPREEVAPGWRGKAWNQDYAWFRKEEARQFLPGGEPKPGQKHEVPAPLVRRLARAHLVDNVRGQTRPYDDRHVEKARLTAVVEAVDGDVVTLRLEGETRTAAEGVWHVGGLRSRQATPQKRGFEANLLGRAAYDMKTERFQTFELVAVGTRWGATQFNVRQDDMDPAPIGVLFTLAGDSPWERVAPAFFSEVYGWRR
jgi:hypothetical protein